jgi:hypothetical protein
LTVPCGQTATRAVIGELIASIEPYDRIEAGHQREALAWVHSGQPLFRTDPPDPHFARFAAKLGSALD